MILLLFFNHKVHRNRIHCSAKTGTPPAPSHKTILCSRWWCSRGSILPSHDHLDKEMTHKRREGLRRRMHLSITQEKRLAQVKTRQKNYWVLVLMSPWEQRCYLRSKKTWFKGGATFRTQACTNATGKLVFMILHDHPVPLFIAVHSCFRSQVWMKQLPIGSETRPASVEFRIPVLSLVLPCSAITGPDYIS
jgi:hypothetical protein